jgi:hypothetical protein
MRLSARWGRIGRARVGGIGARVSVVATLAGLALSAGAIVSTAAQATCPNASYLTGPSAGLPDCRAYEQVSPADKGGFSAYAPQGTPAQTLRSGDALAYLNYNAFPGGLGNSALYAGHISSRSAGGWNTTEMSPHVPEAQSLKTYLVSYAFSDDLSQAIVQVPLVPLTEGTTPGAFNLFHRHPDGTFTLVNDVLPITSVAEQCLSFLRPICFLIFDRPAFAGASSDYSHVLFESSGQLAPEAPPSELELPSLYENFEGVVKLVGILPDKTAAQGSTAGAGSSNEYISSEQEIDGRVEHAISSDGSHVIFQAPADGGEPEPAQAGLPQVYDRIDGENTIELSAPAPGATPAVATSEPAKFWAASEDGSRVFFTSSAELTTPSNTGGESLGTDLYEYDFAKPLAERLTDLTVDAGDESGAEVQGVVDISKDGSYVYFVAKAQLDGSKGKAGQANLYMEHNGGKPVFVATLDGSAPCAFLSKIATDSCDWTSSPVELEAYVAPDGKHLAFMSTESLPTSNFPSGYDNVDQNTEKPVSEVYEYSAPTSEEEAEEGSGQLVCASCEAGVKPIGSALLGGIVQTEEPELGRQPYSGISTPFYRVRAMNEEGTRVFYSAPVPHGNPYDRVYEFEPNGTGACAMAGGCSYLISRPGGSEPDQFLGASGSGNDVFIASSNRLSSGDQDNLRDVYDARVDGGFATPSPTPGCENNCRESQSGEGAPTLQGDVAGPSGNVPPATATPPKALTRAQKLAKALKACRAKKNRHRRASCEASARHRYGPPKQARAKKSSNNERRAK